MKQMHSSFELMLSSVMVAAALGIAGLPVLAQTAPTPTVSTTTPVTAPRKPTTSTDQMVQEACQRQKARTAKFQQFGIPETFGSENPEFVFDPNAPKC
ncbi:MAG TPA: hypothetical protein VKF35_17165 [Hyphomicrobiaceae bacterium]|nr:hypothetical protein [Hyphomicrobiaceae bacterium]